MTESRTPPHSVPVSAGRLAGLNLLIFAPVGVQLPFTSLWYASIGFGAEAIALIQGATPIARFVSNLVIPPIADRRGNAARLLAACAIGATIFFCAAGLYPKFWFVFACVVAAVFAQGPMVALGDSMVLREARRRVVEGDRPLDYGAIRGIGSISVLLLMIVSGWFVGLLPPDMMIFIIAFVIAATVPGILALAPPTPPAVKHAAAWSREKIARPGLVALVVSGAALIQASHAMVYTFGSIAFRQQGFSDVMIGLLWAAGVLTEVAFFVLSSRFGGAARAYAFLLAGGGFAVLRWLMMTTSLPLGVLFLAQAMHAATFAATHLGAVFALTRLVGESRRAQAQGWISGVNALIYAAVTIGSGEMWGRYGVAGYYGMAAVAAAGVVLVAIAALDRRKDM